MNESCTCGAKLPEDARFCHKCGRPLREEPEIEALEQASLRARETGPAVNGAMDTAVETRAVPEPTTTIGFRNPMAVRSALIASALATAAGLVPLPGPFHSIWQFVTITASGFVSVYFYQRRTGNYLTLRGGLQIGWMAGLFGFVIIVVMLTLLLAFLASAGDSAIKQLSAESGRPEIAQAFESLLTSPATLIFVLAGVFFLMTVLASAGGALGSKILDKE